MIALVFTPPALISLQPQPDNPYGRPDAINLRESADASTNPQSQPCASNPSQHPQDGFLFLHCPSLAPRVPHLALLVDHQLTDPSVYLIPTIVSFIPQLHRLYTHRTATALSGRYLLFHVIVSVETFSLMLLATISAPESEYRNQPRVQPGDWLNLAQTAVEASGWLAMYAPTLYHTAKLTSSDSHCTRTCQRRGVTFPAQPQS